MLGITLESLGQPLRTAVVTAAQAGVQGLVFDATGQLGPDSLGETARREVRHLLQSHLLSCIALRCPLKRGLDEIDGLEVRLERLRRAMQLSFDLGARLVLLGIGAVPAETANPAYERMKAFLTELSQFGDRIGCRIALDAGLEPIEALLSLIQSIDTGSLGVTIDPATLLIEKQPLESTLLTAKDALYHTYVRDAIPRRIDRAAREVPLGQGDIDWLTWLGTLEACNYHGPVTIRQPVSATPLESAKTAVQFMRKLGVR